MDTTKIENKLIECADFYDYGKQDVLNLLRAYQLGRYGDLATLTLASGYVADDIKELNAIKDALDHMVSEVDKEDCNEQQKIDRKQNKFADIVLKIFDEEKALYKKKAEQYAQGDPLANFRGGAALEGLNPDSLDDCFKVLLMYMAKHVAFVYQSGKLGEKEDESMGDIGVYANIARAMWRLKKENE